MSSKPSLILGTSSRPMLSHDGRTLCVHIPIALRHQGGRKQVVTPADVAPWITRPARVDSTLVKAIVRAHRWRDMLESGRYATVRDLAEAEKINESYLGRTLRLTLLAPAIVEAVLNGRQQSEIELEHLLKPFPIEWAQQICNKMHAGATPVVPLPFSSGPKSLGERPLVSHASVI